MPLLQWSWPFNAPVDLQQYPDYGEAIKTPMDFSTIKRRIDAVSYPHPDAFLADVRLVFDNARQYNKPGSDVHVMANTLQVGGRVGGCCVGADAGVEFSCGVWGMGCSMRFGSSAGA